MESLVAVVASPAAGGKLGRCSSDDQLVPLSWLADLQDDDTASDSSSSELLAVQRDLDCSAANTAHEFDEHEDEEEDEYDEDDASPGFDDFYYSHKDCGAYSVEARNKGRNRPKRWPEARECEPRIKQRAGARALMTMQENREPFEALDCLRLPPAAMRRVACAHCHKSLDTTAFASSQLKNKKAGSARCRVCVAQMHAAFLQQLPPRKYKMSTVKAKTRDVRSSVDPKALARKCSGAISGSIEFNRLRQDFLARHFNDLLAYTGYEMRAMLPLTVSSAVEQRFLKAARNYQLPSQMVFHGTLRKNHSSILQQGLMIGGHGVPVANGAAYGAGIYTARDMGTSMGYARGDNAVFVCGLVNKAAWTGNIAVIDQVENVCPLFLLECVSEYNTDGTVALRRHNETVLRISALALAEAVDRN